MNLPRNIPKETGELGAVWIAVPLLWVVAAIAGLLIVTSWPTLLADPLPAEIGSASSTLAAAPAPDTDPSVPAASTVFTQRTWEVSEPVAQF
jgi:hypothetical protein